ncbi:MAG TPA: PAS domain S-box protein [Pirellulaceae bacterium]|nr:PAS domain S-box protein [Pirellulaceae bacterium]
MTADGSAALDVLIVEDDLDTCANLADILTLDGHRCEAVGNFAAALERLGAPGISAVIVDRQLPDGKAEQFLPRFKTLAPELPIVVVTGHPDIENAVQSLRQGAYDYLLKPVNPEVLRASLRRIADRQRYVDQLRRQRDFAESMIETAQAIVLLMDDQGNIRRYNSFMEELSGVPLSEVIGRSWFDVFVPPGDRERLREVFARVIDEGSISGHENVIRTRNGGLRTIDWSARVLEDADGRRGVLGIGHDITDLRAAQEMVVRNERLAAIGEMVTGLAHESRNAFQRSQACLEMLALDLEGNDDALRNVERIQSALDHLRGLYEQVRSYAAPIVLQRQEVDPAGVLRQTWSHLEGSREGRQVELEIDQPHGAVRVLADPSQLEQVFRNLLENSLDACGTRGRIAARFDRDPSLPGRIAIEIRDDGPGIPLEYRDRIFEPFFTTKTRGTGLGMAIVRRIVEAHGGGIAVLPGNTGAAIGLGLPAA